MNGFEQTVFTTLGTCISVMRYHLHGFRPAVVAISIVSLLSGCVTSSAPTGETFVAPQAVSQIKERYAALNGSRAGSAVTGSNVREAGAYMLGPGDSLTIFLQRVPGGSYDVVVRPDGYISLPIIDEVRVAGLTPAQLDEQLTDLYAERFVEPELSVIVRALREPMIYVMGRVSRPGPISFNQASSAAEAIARAGDIMPLADVNNVTIIRLGDDGVIRSLALKTDANNTAFDSQAGPYMVLAATQLEPEDIVFVPEREISRLGTDLQQALTPITSVGGTISNVLSPWLLWELLKDLTGNGATGVGVTIQ